MECPHCEKEVEDAWEVLPKNQEEQELFQRSECKAFFAGWWACKHYSREITKTEAGKSSGKTQ